ncbi:hypothetical protein HDE_09077 [Halotydeus destructor]|nr:hypothetical protein HDE_09077 [Halotydeus destructor]
MMNFSTMWVFTCVGIIIILLLLVASTTFKCLSSSALASILQIVALVVFIVLFGILFMYFLGSNSDFEDNLEQFTKKAKARAKQTYIEAMVRNATLKRLMMSTTTLPPS